MHDPHRLLTAFERRKVQVNAALLAAALTVAYSSEIQRQIAQSVFILSASVVRRAAWLLCALALYNVCSCMATACMRVLGQDGQGAAPDAPAQVLQPPRGLRREPVPSGVSRMVEEAVATIFSEEDAPLPSTAAQSPLLPPIPPGVNTTPRRAYGGGASMSAQSVADLGRSGGTLDATHAGTRQTPGTPGKSAGGSPLPATGSPRMDSLMQGVLPSWTERLRQTVMMTDGSPKSPLSSVASAPAAAPSAQPADRPASQARVVPTVRVEQRALYDPARSVAELGLAHSIDEATDALRVWLVNRILQPLVKDVADVTAHFSRAGLDHLGPTSPAAFPAMGRASGAVAGIAGGANMRPQTLFDLSQQSPNDPVVQRRLRLERYLAFGGVSGQRGALIRRIQELSDARGPLVSFRSVAVSLSDVPPFGDEDVALLVHLFCVFMDEQLPCEELYETSPFSSRHFVGADDRPSARPEAVQLQQVSRQPAHFRLIVGGAIYDTHPGAASLFHAIVYLVEWVHRACGGYLGVGNLASPSIDLVSILCST